MTRFVALLRPPAPTPKAGYLKAVWPDFVLVGNRSCWGSGRPRGPGKAFKNVGAKPEYVFPICFRFVYLFPHVYILSHCFPLFLPFFSLFKVSGHVEVGSSSKDPAFDLFARVGRRGASRSIVFGPGKGSPLYVAKKS